MVHYQNIGNHLRRDITLSREEKKILLECGAWLKEQGYYHPKGYLCGADFCRSETDFKLLEINGRWTGGHVAYRVLEKLSIGNEDVYCVIDLLSPDKIQSYQKFIDTHLYYPRKKSALFMVVPLGIIPRCKGEKELDTAKIKLMIIGDMHAFVEGKNAALGEEELSRSNVIAATVSETPL